MSSRCRNFARGVMALLALLVLLAGVPAGLLLVAGSPVPHVLPGWHHVVATLTQPDNGTVFLGAVRLVSWVAWLAFAFSVAADITARIRGRQAPRLRGLSGAQRLAAYLVTSIAIAFSSTATAALAATPPAAPAAVATTPAVSHERIQVVRSGDTLSQIAQDDLGNWTLYKQIFRDSQHLRQPDGRRLTSPDLIYPGERLVISEDASPAARSRPLPAGDATPHAAPAASNEPASAPASGVGPGTLDTGRPQAAAAQEQHPGIPVVVLAGYSALFASVTLNVLTLKRRIQQRRRKPGHRIKLPPAMSDTERGIRAAAEPGSVTLLDRGLRSLAAQVIADGGELPAITGALVTGHGVELCPASPAKPTAPFTSAEAAPAWHLDTASKALLPADDTQDIPAPYPALATLGDDPDGTHVLADLVEIGAISLHGQPEHVREVLTALALEMAASPWADFIVIHCAGFGAELPRLTGSGRLRRAASIDNVLASMRSHADDVSAVLAGSGVATVREARSRQVGADAWTPEIILSAEPLTGDQLEQITDLVTADPDLVNLAAVVAAVGEDSALPGPWQLEAAPGRSVVLPVLNREITLQRVTSDQYEELVSDLATADDDSGTDVPGWEGVPSEDDAEGHGETEPSSVVNEDDAEPQPGRDPSQPPAVALELEVRVLGAVEVAGRDVADIESGKRNLLPELAAYLRLYPGRTAEEVSRAMGGPRGPWAAATRASNMSRLRAWLGRDDSGRNYVPAQGEGRLYTLSDQVGCDWDTFQTLAKRGLGAGPGDGIADLRAALGLVRGQPLAGAGPHSYIWAEFLKQGMISAIVDVAHTLAVWLTDAGDPAGARAAVGKGLEVEPGSELLYRDLFRAEHQAGNAAGIEEAAERLMVTLAELDLDLQPQTAELLQRLRAR